MTDPVRILLIFVNEADLWDDAPLYEAIVRRLKALGIAGATAQAGLIGFGHHHRVHDKGLLGMAADRPVTILAVDREETLRLAVPQIRAMVEEGLMLMLPADVVVDAWAERA